jgi:hypothetical protein
MCCVFFYVLVLREKRTKGTDTGCLAQYVSTAGQILNV